MGFKSNGDWGEMAAGKTAPAADSTDSAVVAVAAPCVTAAVPSVAAVEIGEFPTNEEGDTPGMSSAMTAAAIPAESEAFPAVL